jgi:hypothetical protein
VDGESLQEFTPTPEDYANAAEADEHYPQSDRWLRANRRRSDSCRVDLWQDFLCHHLDSEEYWADFSLEEVKAKIRRIPTTPAS